MTHHEIIEELKAISSVENERRFSVRSLQCFCVERNIHITSRLSEGVVEEVVAEAIVKVRNKLGYATA